MGEAYSYWDDQSVDYDNTKLRNSFWNDETDIDDDDDELSYWNELDESENDYNDYYDTMLLEAKFEDGIETSLRGKDHLFIHFVLIP